MLMDVFSEYWSDIQIYILGYLGFFGREIFIHWFVDTIKQIARNYEFMSYYVNYYEIE